jgi:hypothetical protein
MAKFWTLIGSLLVIVVLMSTLNLSQAAPNFNEFAPDTDDDDSTQEQRRELELNQFRRSLLALNNERRASQREQQLYKRELLRDYLQSLVDQDTDRAQTIRKRFKTYCNSYEDLMNSNWAACG